MEVSLLKKFNLSNKALAAINVLAMILVIQTSNAACLWMFNQPEYPEEAKKYSRIR
ncbi:MAG: cyclic lactone autoinducer peptide [Lachnospiraceae bacterium]|nr:cyclic lactone autoinducer peptide [Lachnospiraceae bacterium]MBR1598640.1 cyclic lactone autoinducer peptide [Lachnospiraceae bacterium]